MHKRKSCKENVPKIFSGSSEILKCDQDFLVRCAPIHAQLNVCITKI